MLPRHLIAGGLLLALLALPHRRALADAFPPELWEQAKDNCVRLTADVHKDPASITLHWLTIPQSLGFVVLRSPKDAETWATLATLPSTATTFADTHVQVGAAYDYKVITSMEAVDYSGELLRKIEASYRPIMPVEMRKWRFGYILSGIEVPLTDARGKIVVVVESSQAAPLAHELDRLRQDLIGDGWTVLRHDLPADATPPALRTLIQNDYHADPANVKAVFLIGHLPVARSGDYTPDGHTDRRGAQTADVYYADMDGIYTDIGRTPPLPAPNSPPAATAPATQDAHLPHTLEENVNLPGDGRFDQSFIPGSKLLQLGRIDFDNLPAFAPRTQTDMLRTYLDKDHNYRHKRFTLQERCLVHDHIPAALGWSIASTIWRSCTPMFGPQQFTEDKFDSATPGGHWFQTLCDQDYLWAYCCAGSGRAKCGDIVSTNQLANADPKVAFLMMLGSYFCDWDVKNDLMRAFLATPSYTLVCAWSGMPELDFHAMALGETAGYCLRWSQRPDHTTGLWTGAVHISMLGDPTLRLHVVPPPTNLQAPRQNGSVHLTWTASPDRDVIGYNIYRAPSPDGPFTRMGDQPLPAAAWTDPAAPAAATYMVRAVKLQTTPSGTYFNASQGAFAK